MALEAKWGVGSSSAQGSHTHHAGAWAQLLFLHLPGLPSPANRSSLHNSLSSTAGMDILTTVRWLLPLQGLGGIWGRQAIWYHASPRPDGELKGAMSGATTLEIHREHREEVLLRIFLDSQEKGGTEDWQAALWPAGGSSGMSSHQWHLVLVSLRPNP